MWKDIFAKDENVLIVYVNDNAKPSKVWITVKELKKGSSSTYSRIVQDTFNVSLSNISVDTRECDVKDYFPVFVR